MKSIEKKIYLGLFVCMMVSVAGVSFAYFTTSTSFTGEGGKVNAKTADLIKVKYDAGTSALSLPPNAIPGNSASKTFTVTVNPTADEDTATYSIFLDITTNGFTKCVTSSTNDCIDANELVYTLKESEQDKAGETTLTNVITDLAGQSTGKIELAKLTKKVSKETIFTYTMEITFVNTGHDQNHNANKTFTGSIGVEFADPTTT